MNKLTAALALLAIAFTASACDPHQAITNALPEGCNPSQPVPFQKDSAQHQGSVTSGPTVNIPADEPNTER